MKYGGNYTEEEEEEEEEEEKGEEEEQNEEKRKATPLDLTRGFVARRKRHQQQQQQQQTGGIRDLGGRSFPCYNQPLPRPIPFTPIPAMPKACHTQPLPRPNHATPNPCHAQSLPHPTSTTSNPSRPIPAISILATPNPLPHPTLPYPTLATPNPCYTHPCLALLREILFNSLKATLNLDLTLHANTQVSGNTCLTRPYTSTEDVSTSCYCFEVCGRSSDTIDLYWLFVAADLLCCVAKELVLERGILQFPWPNASFGEPVTHFCSS
ncbi:hypothetical protein O3P69_002416 [Scylla paramamosain]|uniref:Uncharacterized protein n=1 Tax=Scylla paramamosain TaxID=85552 RepID=A0AAW0V8G4_SCYPA